MMKKAYTSPETIKVKISTMHMIAASQDQALSGASDYSEGGTLTGARGSSSIWDDDYED